MNLEDIAKLAGVSRSTVSRVVNDDPKVGEATREKVLRVIQQKNYHPNIAARGLAAGRTRILGVVIPRGVSALFTDPYFPLLLQGVSATCNALDHSVMLWLAEPEYERRMIHKIMHSHLIDGVIVASVLTDDPMVEALVAGDLPFILVGRHPNQHPISQQVSYIDIDNATSAHEMVMHLLRLGRRRIATITGPQNMVPGVDRLEGYLSALRERGLPADPNLIVESDFSEAGGQAAMQRLLPHKPDAVFVASDMMAIGALRTLREAGVRVPEELSVASFDDMPFAARSEPPLTTLRQPVHRMGVVVAETLIDMIEHPSPTPRRIVLPTEIVIRQSCGATQSIAKRSA